MYSQYERIFICGLWTMDNNVDIIIHLSSVTLLFCFKQRIRQTTKVKKKYWKVLLVAVGHDSDRERRGGRTYYNEWPNVVLSHFGSVDWLQGVNFVWNQNKTKAIKVIVEIGILKPKKSLNKIFSIVDSVNVGFLQLIFITDIIKY